jgi:hypothetical protein
MQNVLFVSAAPQLSLDVAVNAGYLQARISVLWCVTNPHCILVISSRLMIPNIHCISKQSVVSAVTVRCTCINELLTREF